MARFLSLCLLCLAITPAAISTDSPASVPDSRTPPEMVQAWLRFHSSELCQELDAEFEFSPAGMEVRSLVEDARGYQKLEELLNPLRRSYTINLHPEYPPEKEESDDKKEKDPPPSLWENYELRSFLGDPFARARESVDFEERPHLNVPPPPDELLKQRLFLYAEQTLDWNRNMERYAKDLPALTRIAVDPAMAPTLRSQANAICRSHLQNMDRYISKLYGHLRSAFPHSDEKGKSGDMPAAPVRTVVDRADRIADYARTVERRVYHFIHPEHHTVGLGELRQPGLLGSLKILQKMDSDYAKALAKAN